jgi:hypothetical protein
MANDSSLTGLRPDHVRLIGRYWMRFSMRTGGGLMTVLVVLIAGLSIASAFTAPIEMAMGKSGELGHTAGETASAVDRVARSDEVANIARSVTGADASQVAYLLQRQPALLSAMLLVMLMVFPFITCLGAFNQTAGDIGNRGLRYLLLRTERPNVFIGRFVGTLGFLATSTASVLLILALYVGFKFNIYPLADLVPWTLQGFLAIFFVCLPYVALCAWMSGLLDSPFGSLSICLLLTGFPIIFVKMANVATRDAAPWLEKLLPWGWKYDLLSGEVGARLLAYVVMLGFTALFLSLGLRSFRKRDL